MQTFLPHSDYVQSAACLDNRRLGKQRVEALQILRAIADPNYGWRNHPAVRMWRQSPSQLCLYGAAVILEWKQRGFQDTCLEKICQLQKEQNWFKYTTSCPAWFGNAAFHASHRSNLLRKDPQHYGQFGWAEPDNLPYVWPG